MDDFESRYAELVVAADDVAAARAMSPIRERQVLGRTIFLYDGADRERLAALGELRSPSIADLFVALVGGEAPRQAAA
jgi:ABC-2 type transport system ATP-binding protein